MSRSSRIRFVLVIVLTISLSPFLGGVKGLSVAVAGGPPTMFDGNEPKGPKKDDKKDKDKDKDKKKPTIKVRWGQRRNEADTDYDKRYSKVLKRVKQDKKLDFSGGRIVDQKGEPVRMWTYMGHTGCPFICRSDISREFSADLAMYMEMLHREYSGAYKIILGFPAQVKEKVEVIVFADPGTYMKNGGIPGSGGFFTSAAQFGNDRSISWPARHYRLVQFTEDIRDFAKWPKGTLKHESGHMELQLRVGYKSEPRLGGLGFPIQSPTWWNEGQAMIFEDWDFALTVEENFTQIPNRGRYAPYIRRIHDTDRWKDFEYLWKIDPSTWRRDLTTPQGFLNYAQSWSLVAYMIHEGTTGRKDFRAIFDLTKRVGVDEQKLTADRKVVGSDAWENEFPQEDQTKIEDHWNKWVSTYLSRDKRVPDEEFALRRGGYNPAVTDRLERFATEEEQKANKEWVEKEEARRKKAKVVEW